MAQDLPHHAANVILSAAPLADRPRPLLHCPQSLSFGLLTDDWRRDCSGDFNRKRPVGGRCTLVIPCPEAVWDAD